MEIMTKNILKDIVNSVQPDDSIKRIIEEKTFGKGRIIIVSIGKAAHKMSLVVSKNIKHFDKGILITKYGHITEKIDGFEMYEAGHPILDENTILATRRVLELTKDLNENDTVLFLVSGGGSALFEDPLIPLDKLQSINEQLIKSGADINEINTIRKHLSKVKGGNFAKHIYPAKVYSIIISDVLGDKIESIASGPCYKDTTTLNDCLNIIEKYKLKIPKDIIDSFIETPKEVNNCSTVICSSVKQLCDSTSNILKTYGYNPIIIKTNEDRFAEEVGKELSLKAIDILNSTKEKTALIIGGETLVKVKGNGLGGRNQHLALSCAPYIKNKDITIIALGSDGTDGPTDGAGGVVDGDTLNKLNELKIDIDEVLNNNDSYHALEKIGALIKTGPTGTNINDVYIALINTRTSN